MTEADAVMMIIGFIASFSITSVVFLVRDIGKPPRQRPVLLSPEAFDAKMRELESDRLVAIGSATSQEDIDNVNRHYDVRESLFQRRKK
jgi:dolichol kinase